MEKDATNQLKETSNTHPQPPINGVNNQKGFLPIILGVLVLLLVVGGGAYYLGSQKNIPIQSTQQKSTSPTVASPTSTTKTEPTSTFQNILIANCLNKSSDRSMSGEIDLEKLPLSIKLTDLKSNKGSCDSDFAKYVNISLGEENSFMTVSDKNSNHCCHGPSSLEPAGKLVKTNGDISIYIHTGTWGAGPNSGYKAIVARGVKNFKLSNGEEIRVVLDRTALNKTDANLQKIEDKYQIIDPNFDSGAKVLTPETVDKMFQDSFFSNFGESAVVKKIEVDLQGITLK